MIIFKAFKIYVKSLNFSEMSKSKNSQEPIATDTEGKLKSLDDIERKISEALKCSGMVISELAKDKVNEKQAEKQTDKFLREIDEVETELSRIIQYLGQVIFRHRFVNLSDKLTLKNLLSQKLF